MKVSARAHMLASISWNAFKASWWYHGLHRLGEPIQLDYAKWKKLGRAAHP